MMHLLVIAVTVLVISTRTRAFAPTTTAAPTSSITRSFFLAAAADVTTVDKTPFADTASSTEQDDIDDENAFHLIASTAAACLLQSDLRRVAMGGGEPGKTQASSSAATNWINDASAFALQKAIDKIELKLADERTGLDRDEASTWMRWIKSAPTPLIVDLSPNLREIANTTISDASLELLLDTSRNKFLNRMGCRLLLFPSGSTLKSPLKEPPASIIYGKLLFGGVTRYRMLVLSSNSQRSSRRAGDRTEIKASVRDHVPVWMQYGGPDRQYEAVDMGAAAILELLLLPVGQELTSIAKQATGDMTASRIMWPPQKMFGFAKTSDSITNGESKDEELLLNGNSPMSLSGKERNEAFTSDFRSAVGGLQPQIDAIVRRVLDGRVIRPADADEKEQDGTTAELALATMEAEELAILGLSPVRGLLLYGPPGCGKTALAREISRSLRARAPKIVSAPELLDRW
jgi:vesicle-fusing ATPase